jgi:hypothetical protein
VQDDRFVIKEFSRAEMEAFLSGATGYFQYMAGAIFGARPTTLAKIFGCFRISIRNTQTGKSIKLDCLVIEVRGCASPPSRPSLTPAPQNLFYGRQMHKIFDLKGSLRNRHIRETGRADEVLLDENLVEIASKSPLFVREHDKRLLRAALWNDSLWLERQNVMDYSLVVGLDKDRKELVVGIIDFVRTYTWDKKVSRARPRSGASHRLTRVCDRPSRGSRKPPASAAPRRRRRSSRPACTGSASSPSSTPPSSCPTHGSRLQTRQSRCTARRARAPSTRPAASFPARTRRPRPSHPRPQGLLLLSLLTCDLSRPPTAFV